MELFSCWELPSWGSEMLRWVPSLLTQPNLCCECLADGWSDYFFPFAFEITLISVAVLIYFEAPRCYFGITDEVWAVNSWQGL